MRWLAMAALLAVLAVAGYVGGGLLGWWPWYEVTFEAGRPSLRPGTTGASSPKVPRLSVVVLPLVSESDPDGDWFSDNLCTDLTTELGGFAGHLGDLAGHRVHVPGPGRHFAGGCARSGRTVRGARQRAA
ncbi:MAG TPA: hypothetical protein VKP68_10520 [Ramlibacter sp.]|nr:hypothetical protein [Ramlibacter sp.]